jgi:hypothetical protein
VPLESLESSHPSHPLEEVISAQVDPSRYLLRAELQTAQSVATVKADVEVAVFWRQTLVLASPANSSQVLEPFNTKFSAHWVQFPVVESTFTQLSTEEYNLVFESNKTWPESHSLQLASSSVELFPAQLEVTLVVALE